MIRLYIDWNVMSQMKAGNHSELTQIVGIKDKFLLMYSTSHIGDISASSKQISNKEYIESDLEFISKLTGNRCLVNTGKEVVMEYRDPGELLDERNEMSGLSYLCNFDTLLEDLKGLDFGIARDAKLAIDSMLNSPLDADIKKNYDDPLTASQMKKFLPGLENNLTNRGLLEAILKMFSNLNEQGDYKELRKIVQEGLKINRDRMYATEDPFKQIEEAYRKIQSNYPNITVSNNVAPDWFNELVNEYIKLDMHGYQEDKVEVGKGRKQTFRNTSEDAFHAAFAATCDFYISNDSKNLKKAEAIYERLRKNTLAMSPIEFVEHYNKCLNIPANKSMNALPIITKNYPPNTLSEDGIMRSWFGSFFLFDYFNIITVIKESDNDGFVVLRREKPTHHRVIFSFEIEALIQKLETAFENKDEQIPLLSKSEYTDIAAEKWSGRKWVSNQIQFHLKITNGYLQLYMYPESKNAEKTNTAD